MGEEVIGVLRVLIYLTDKGGLGRWIKIVVILAGIVLLLTRFLSYLWRSSSHLGRRSQTQKGHLKTLMIAMSYAHYTKLIHTELDPKKKKLLLEDRKKLLHRHIRKKHDKVSVWQWITHKIDLYLPLSFRITLIFFITLFLAMPILVLKGSVSWTDIVGLFFLFFILLQIGNFIYHHW